MEETKAPRVIVDVREDTVFCPVTGTKQAPKTCYFLRPSYMECVNGARVPDPPPVVHDALLSLFDGRGQELPPRTKFWQPSYNSKGWNEWVCLMEPLHRETWEKVGIFEAIKCSTYRVMRDSGLLIALAEKWCCDTNTFVFSWGEATVTLEDVYVLGGYPVRGSPIFADVKDGEMRHVVLRMILARSEICRGAARTADSGIWMKMFKGSGSDIEHEAFLAFWLSRFVFMMPQAKISVNVFPVATRLARGHKIALAPAVLAGIYRDLSLAAKVIHGLAAPSGRGDIRVWLRSDVLQVWVWERFFVLQTRPKVIGLDEPRTSRWDGVRNLKLKQVQMDLDMNISSCFEWRPYVNDVKNFKRPGFYPEEGRMDILDGDNVEDEIRMFARCLVPCELVGIDCIEQYLPHRVALQFGMDQDIPGHVARCNENPRVAWGTYDISFCNSSLYIPPRYNKPGMNERYHDWLGSRALEGPAERSKEAAEEDEDSFPAGFPPVPPSLDVGEDDPRDVGEDDDDCVALSHLRSKTRKCISGRSRASYCVGNLSRNNKGVATSGNPSSTEAATGFDGPAERLKEAAEEDEDSFAPGFPPVPPSWDVGEANGEDDDNRATLSHLRSKTRKYISGRSRANDCGGNLSRNNKGVATSGNPSSTEAATGFDGPAERSKEAAEEDEYSFPPGFLPVPPSQDVGEANGEDDDDRATLSHLRSNTRKCISGRNRASDCGGNLSRNNKGVVTSGNPSSTDAATRFDVALDVEPKGESAPTDPSTKEDAAVENNETPPMNPICEREIPRRTAWRSRSTFEVDMLELDLYARISEIQRDVAAIKAARRMRQLMALQRGNEG